MDGRNQLSRREFATLAAAAPLAFGARSPATAAVSALDVIERIKRQIAVEWRPDTVDAIKAGDPSTMVTGIVTTSIATIAVLREAVKTGANLVITGEPTFYSRSDASTPPAARGTASAPGSGPGSAAAATHPPDPIFAAKNDLITSRRLVVFRLHDHWRLRSPDPLAQGLGDALGWTRHRVSGSPARYDVPAVTLAALVSHVRKALNARGGMRVIGDPQTSVRRIALLPGSTPIAASLEAFAAADVVIGGEVREWESAEYVRDLVHAGRRKGLILVGRLVSEEPGMRACADWLKTLVPEVPVRHVGAGDPYWRPE